MGLNTSEVVEIIDEEQFYDDDDDDSLPEKHPIDWSDETDSETDESEFHVYKRRFYILAVYSFASILQIILWNTWAPITETVFTVLDWNQSDIALLSMWGGIISAFFCIPFAGIMDKFGIRIMFLLAETFALIGAVIRCVPVRPEHLKWTANFGQFFIALAGPFLVQGPPLVSATWFPPHQRSTATTVGSTSMVFGVALSFIIGPLMVGDATLLRNETFHSSVDNWTTDSLSQEVKQTQIGEIYLLLYIECAAIALINLVAWIYFPAKPPTPPCRSASKPREDFIPGMKKLIRNVNGFWLASLSYGICIGIPFTWLTQLVVMFNGTVGLSQDTVSWISFSTHFCGVIAAFITSRFVDFIGKMKLVILSLLGLAIACFLWLLLMVYQVIPFNLSSLYASTIICGSLMKSARPIYYDLVCESVYPVGEGITSGVLNWLCNVIGLTFLFVMAMPNVGVFWMNWTVLGSVISGFLLLVVFKDENKRLEEDRGNSYQLLKIPTTISKNSSN